MYLLGLIVDTNGRRKMTRKSLARMGACLPIALIAFVGCSDCAETTGDEALAQAATELNPAWEGLPADSAENWI